MFTKPVALVALVAALVVPIVARATPAQHHPDCCTFEVSSVRAVYESVPFGKTTWRQLRGAELVVPAERGMTREWLQRTLDAHIADAAKSADCPLGVGSAQISVEAGRGAFLVRITSFDQTAAQSILHRAQAMKHG